MRNFLKKKYQKIITAVLIAVVGVGLFMPFAQVTAFTSQPWLPGAGIPGVDETAEVNRKLLDVMTTSESACSFSLFRLNVGAFAECLIGRAFEIVSTAALQIVASIILPIPAILLNFTLDATVVNMGKNIEKIVAIDTGWKAFRDLANMFFIFILLYIAISTILGREDYGIKRLVPRLIIVALLINFSLFFTKVLIDGSNMIALTFYDAIVPGGPGVDWLGTGLTGAFADSLNLIGLYEVEIKAPGAGGAGALAADLITLWVPYFGAVLMAIIFILITAFVFLMLAFLFISRFIILVFLMVLSPIAFAAMILPGTSGYANRWWKKLFDQLLFAPAVMMFLWFSLQVASQLKASNIFNTGGSWTAVQFAGVMKNNLSAGIGVVFNFIIVIAAILASIFIAKELSIAGSSTVMRWGRNARTTAQSFVGRNTIGFAATKFDDKLANTNIGKSVAGSTIREMTTGKLANSKFGGAASYKQRQDERKAELGKGVEKVGTDSSKLYAMGSNRGNLMSGYTGSDRENIYQKMNDQQKVAFEEEARRRGDARTLAEISNFKAKLNRDQKEKIEEARVKQFENNPVKIAAHIKTLPPELQAHVYQKGMNPATRAAVEKELLTPTQPTTPGTPPILPNPALAQNLKNKLSPEEREKDEDRLAKRAEKEAKDLEKREKAALTAQEREIQQDLERHTTGTVNPRTNAPYTPAELDDLVGKIRLNAVTELPSSVKKNPEFIRRLSQRHLAELQKSGKLSQEEVEAIVSQATSATPYPKQKDQLDYIKANQTSWM